MNKQEKWRSTRKKRKVLTCSSQDAKREEEAAWSGMATALSKDGAGVVGVASGCGGVGAFNLNIWVLWIHIVLDLDICAWIPFM